MLVLVVDFSLFVHQKFFNPYIAGVAVGKGGSECRQYSLQVHEEEWNLEHGGGVDVAKNFFRFF